MKIYEFTYTDNQNLSESEMLVRLQEILEKESSLQGWAPGYRLQECRKVEQLPSGGRNLYFEVLGRYLDSESMNVNEEPKVTYET
jgi:hypothetical protein